MLKEATLKYVKEIWKYQGACRPEIGNLDCVPIISHNFCTQFVFGREKHEARLDRELEERVHSGSILSGAWNDVQAASPRNVLQWATVL
jgi:hypothetical protein